MNKNVEEIADEILKDFHSQLVMFQNERSPFKTVAEVRKLFTARIVKEIGNKINEQIRGDIICMLTE